MNFTAMIQGVGRLREAMECGKEIANPASWKNKSILANKIMIILSFGLVALKAFGVTLPISEEDLLVLATGLSCLLYFANIVITIITSKKVGS